MGIRQSFCKHNKYIILKCEKDKRKYQCQCEKCGYQFELPKAIDEMYEVGSHIKR
jgi:hypothetical protein